MKTILAIMSLWGCCFSGFAFDVSTHAAVTTYAISQSNLSAIPNASALFLRLGLFDPGFARSQTYVDIGATTTVRQLDPTTNRRTVLMLNELLGALAAAGLAVNDINNMPGWIFQGVVREDDNRIETADSDEPGGVFNRVYGHFFDPQNNRGLTVGVPLGDRAVDWGLLPSATVTQLPFSPFRRGNHFNIANAREAMWRALTLTAADGNGGFNSNVWPSTEPTPSAESLRQAYWATTFRSLGDVIHLIQDMAQPQHTRNDMHSGLGCVSGTTSCALGHASFFEAYLKARTLQADTFSLDEGFAQNNPGLTRATKAAQLRYDGYPKPSFNSYSEFFGPGEPGANVSGTGLANYSNRGFYSFGTNINSSAAITSYPSPDPRGVGLSQEIVSGQAFKDMTGTPIMGSLTLMTGTVYDTAHHSLDEPAVRLSAVGIWDQFLQQRNGSRSYSLNYYNYDDQAELLIPRAVAYSAGLIDYFFRGQMSINLPDSGVYAIVDHADFAGTGAASTDVSGYKGFATIRLKLQNTTPDIVAPDSVNYPQDFGAGTLVAIAKFRRNLCYTDNLSGEPGTPNFDAALCRSDSEEIVRSQFVTVSSVQREPKEFEFTFDQQLPINATNLYLQVVFRGALGSEADAVVVATKDISEPTYITFMNATDYVAMAGHPVFCGTLPQGCGSGRSLGASFQFYPQGVNGPAGARIGIHVPLKRIARIALLTDAQPDLQPIYNAVVVPPIQFAFGPAANQVDFRADGSTFTWYTPVSLSRGAYFGRTALTWLISSDGTLTSPSDQVPYAEMTLPLDDMHPVTLENLAIPAITP